MLDSLDHLRVTDFPPLRRARLETLQVNLGYLCNQQCKHCHVDAGPRRTEIMTAETIDTIIGFLEHRSIRVLDLTGGAPELNPGFSRLVEAARKLGVHVIDRCNLTVLQEPGMDWLAKFLHLNCVEIIASLPCYLEENVDQQRGNGVFERSIEALRSLNDIGYGTGDADHALNLVYNPQGASLPPAQEQLQADYKRELSKRFGIEFDHLFTITNMPIKRFGSMLLSKGEFHDYMQMLKDAHLSENVSGVMCRNLISIDWQGYVYDCDFNQMLGLSAIEAGSRLHISEIMDRDLEGEPIVIMDHCYGCTAGQGSSCGGALS